MILWHLRRGLKPRPFKTDTPIEFFQRLKPRPFKAHDFWRELMGHDTSRLLNNSFGSPEVSPAAKAAIDFVVLTARLEAAPLQNGHRNRVLQLAAGS
jgi:hypothetical protein